MKKYKQLNSDNRCQLEVLLKEGYSQAEIATVLGVAQSTISRELNRNTGLRGYRHKQAESRAIDRRQNAAKFIKMTPQMITFIESQLRENWSPEQISGHLKETGELYISHETIYLHIWTDKKAGGTLFTSLRRRGKAYQPRSKKLAGRGYIKNRVGIEHRPEVVDDKSRVGDWEIDLVIGHGHSGALVTLVERATSFTLSRRINDKSADTVTQVTIALLKPYKEAVLTITADNGKEFAYHQKITKALSADVFFADPYCSWQRGLNENTNGLLRQYWPKKTDFKEVSQQEVTATIIQLNDRPRKKLNYKTPSELMGNHMSKIAA